jgi:hypothetical protein
MGPILRWVSVYLFVVYLMTRLLAYILIISSIQMVIYE